MKKIISKIFNYRIDEHLEELLRGSSIALVIKVLAAVLGMILNIIITRTLGIEDSGLYFLALTIIMIMATMGRFGTDGILVKSISAAAVNNDWAEIKYVYKSSVFLVFITSLFLTIVLYASASSLSESLFNKPELGDILQLMSLSVMPIALYTLHASALQGLKKIRDSNITLVFIMPIIMVLGTLSFLDSYGIDGLVNIYVCSSFLTLILGWFFWKNHSSKMKEINTIINISKIMHESLPLFKVSIFGVLMSASPMIFLGLWGTETELGGFQIASRIAMLTTFVLTAVNSIFAPKLSGHFSRSENNLVLPLIVKATALMFIAVSPFLLILFMFPEKILAIFGDGFEKYSTVLIVLAFGQLVNVITGSVGQVLVMSGNQEKQKNAFLIATIASILMGIYAVPKYGALGAALASSSGLIVVNLLSVLFVFRYVNFK